MASIKGHKSSEMGLHEEVLTGRTQQVFFNQRSLKTLFIMIHMMLILTKEQKLMRLTLNV